MTTYILSQLADGWTVHRLNDEISEPFASVATEEEAIQEILGEITRHLPVQILRVPSHGRSRIIAKFESSQDVIGQAERQGMTVSDRLRKKLSEQ